MQAYLEVNRDTPCHRLPVNSVYVLERYSRHAVGYRSRHTVGLCQRYAVSPACLDAVEICLGDSLRQGYGIAC